MDYTLSATQYILEGAIVTAKIWVVTFVVSNIFSIILAFAYERVRQKCIRVPIDGFTTVIRGTPLLFQLYFVYYGLPILANIKFEPYVAALFCFILSWTAYLLEIFRGGIRSVDKGQYEAAYVLGFNEYQTIRYIVLPQALIATIPSVSNQALSLVYGTALVSTIGLPDILKNAKVFVVRDFRLEAFMIAALLYFTVGLVFVKVSKVLENYFSKYKLQ